MLSVSLLLRTSPPPFIFIYVTFTIRTVPEHEVTIRIIEAKVRQLSTMLQDRASAEVVVLREGSMRTVGGESTEGSDAAKNALIIGTKERKLLDGQRVSSLPGAEAAVS